MVQLTKRAKHEQPSRREPETGMVAFRDEMNRLFDDFFTDWGSPFWPATRSTTVSRFVPSVDISETDGEVKVSAELPGMSEKDINVELEEDMLTISGEKRQEESDEEGGRYWRESSYGSFRRDIPLPTAIQSDKAKAAFKNGKLQVTVPKAEDAKEKRRTVPVSAE